MELKRECKAAVLRLSRGIAKVGHRGAGSGAVLSESRSSFEAFKPVSTAYSLSDISTTDPNFLPRGEKKCCSEKPSLLLELEVGLDLDASLARCHCRLPPPLSTLFSQGPHVPAPVSSHQKYLEERQ